MAGIAGLIMQVVGAVGGGVIASSAAKTTRREAKLMAVLATEIGEENVKEFRRGSARRQGTARAAAGVGRQRTGSALDILADNALIEELGAQRIRFDAAMRARGFLRQSDAAKIQKNVAIFGSVLSVGKSAVGSNLLGGRGDMGGQTKGGFSQFQQSGFSQGIAQSGFF